MDRRVYLNRNDASSTAVMFTLPPSMSLSELKKCAKEKLSLKHTPKRLFLASGAEVYNVEEIPNKSNLFFTAGEGFYRAAAGSADKISVSILGAGDVGKSAIALRFIRDAFIQNWDATIEDVYRKAVRVEDNVYMLEILDTAGQEDFSTLRSQWMQNKDGYVFVYSVADKESLAAIYDFIDLLPQVCVNVPVPPIVVVGNKSDLLPRTQQSVVSQSQLRSSQLKHLQAALRKDANSSTSPPPTPTRAIEDASSGAGEGSAAFSSSALSNNVGGGSAAVQGESLPSPPQSISTTHAEDTSESGEAGASVSAVGSKDAPWPNEDSLVTEAEVSQLVEMCRERSAALQSMWIRRQARARGASSSAATAAAQNPTVHVQHIQCSALNGHRVDQVFTSLIGSIRDSRESNAAILKNKRVGGSGGRKEAGDGGVERPKKSKWCWLL